MNKQIRTLKPSEIELKPQIMKENGCSLLLFKNARCDMNILDETFGIMNWRRKHRVVDGNLYCVIEVWDKDKKEWISKEDVGVESFSDKEKGQASDAFKRAGFNWGIGRELYTSPFIWVNLKKHEVYQKKGKWRLKGSVNFEVSEIDYNDDREIARLVISDNDGKIRYQMNSRKKERKGNKLKKEVEGVGKKHHGLKSNVDPDPNIKKCDDCGEKLPDKVINYCKEYSNRFNGKKVCFKCQQNY